jgi:hypothetical protein
VAIAVVPGIEADLSTLGSGSWRRWT